MDEQNVHTQIQFYLNVKRIEFIELNENWMDPKITAEQNKLNSE